MDERGDIPIHKRICLTPSQELKVKTSGNKWVNLCFTK